MSWRYHGELLATPVPRYTSYPTAAEFRDRVGAADMALALANLPPEADVSLYVHIPYCREICWYCGCNTGAANRAKRLTSYLDALEAEIGLVSRLLAGRGRVRRIAFGGGSPNAVAADDFLRIVGRILGSFDCRGAILSVELDPRSLDPSWISAMAATGVSRASLGVQTFAPHVQAAIGRVQPLDVVRRAVDDLRGAGISSLNFDLMYGLPRQSCADLEQTLRDTSAMAPERIALFGYAHVPQIVARQRRIDAESLAPAEVRFDQARLGHEFLTANGYLPAGFDHFALSNDPLAAAARAGRLRRNFQGFTDDTADTLIGLGASAISRFPQLLVQNEKNAGRYRMLVAAGRLAGERGVALSAEDVRRGRVIEALLCHGEADLGALRTRNVVDRLRPFEAFGLVRWTGSRLDITEAGRPYSRAIAVTFDTYREPSGDRFSNAI